MSLYIYLKKLSEIDTFFFSFLVVVISSLICYCRYEKVNVCVSSLLGCVWGA